MALSIEQINAIAVRTGRTPEEIQKLPSEELIRLCNELEVVDPSQLPQGEPVIQEETSGGFRFVSSFSEYADNCKKIYEGEMYPGVREFFFGKKETMGPNGELVPVQKSSVGGVIAGALFLGAVALMATSCDTYIIENKPNITDNSTRGDTEVYIEVTVIVDGLDDDELKKLVELFGKYVTEAVADAIAALGDSLKPILDLLIDNNEQNKDIIKLLNEILTEVKKGNIIQLENNKILKQILDAINGATGDTRALLSTMLDMLTQIIKNQKTDDENRQAEHKAVRDILNAILAKIDTMSADNAAKFKAILAAIQVGNGTLNDIKALLETIRDQFPELMNKLNEILAKIPDDDCDCADKIIVEIEKIITILVNRSDEGVVDPNEIDWTGLDDLLVQP